MPKQCESSAKDKYGIEHFCRLRSDHPGYHEANATWNGMAISYEWFEDGDANLMRYEK